MALLHSNDAEYVDGVMEFLAPGLAAGEPIELAVPERRAAAIRPRLGDSVEVTVLDVHEVADNPGRIISALLAMLERRAGRRLHYVGDFVWPGRSTEELQELMRHEALINLAWPDSAMRVLCAYDTTELDPAVISDARSTHPWLMRGAAKTPSESFEGGAFPGGSDNALPDPPADAITMAFGIAELSAVRRFVSRWGDRAGLTAHVRDDLIIAVNEVATNAIKYAPNVGKLRVWNVGGRVICQLEDRGHIEDPLAGRHRPVPGVDGGLGLWMINQLCALVQTRTTAAGTTIRLHAGTAG